MTVKNRGVLTWLKRWRWVILFVLLLSATSAPLGTWTVEAYRRFGIRNVGVGAVLLLAVAALAILVRLFIIYRSRLSFRLFLGVLAIGASYSYCLLHLAPSPIEKLHFLEYGLLAWLTYTAFQGSRTGNPLLKTITLVFLIGFLDEIHQGFLATRRYDDRDVLLNFVAGSLGVLVTLFMKREDPRRIFPGLLQAGHLPYLALWPLGLAVYLYLHAVPVPRDELLGTWQRTGDCYDVESLHLNPDRSFDWQDKAGNRASGTYRLTANRLEGLYIKITVVQAENKRDCGFRSGLSMNFKIAAYADHFAIMQHPQRPWQRVPVGSTLDRSY
jgi:VanZ family protein